MYRLKGLFGSSSKPFTNRICGRLRFLGGGISTVGGGVKIDGGSVIKKLN